MQRARTEARTRSTYLVEALLILVCLLIVASVVMVVFSYALQREEQTQQEQEAIVLAQNAAERFAADPTSVPNHTMQDAYDIYCETSAEDRGVGVHYTAHVSVAAEGEELFALDTSRYVSARSADAVAGEEAPHEE